MHDCGSNTIQYNAIPPPEFEFLSVNLYLKYKTAELHCKALKSSWNLLIFRNNVPNKILVIENT